MTGTSRERPLASASLNAAESETLPSAVYVRHGSCVASIPGRSSSFDIHCLRRCVQLIRASMHYPDNLFGSLRSETHRKPMSRKHAGVLPYVVSVNIQSAFPEILGPQNKQNLNYQSGKNTSTRFWVSNSSSKSFHSRKLNGTH